MPATAEAGGVDHEGASLRSANQQLEPEPVTSAAAWPEWLTSLVHFWMGAGYAFGITRKYTWPDVVILVAATTLLAYCLTVAFRLIRRAFATRAGDVNGGKVWGIIWSRDGGISFGLGGRTWRP
ncbi:MAG: hypothetical protein JWL61_4964 [Gemmatimonadetes bacterium]|nr:hypothetical protein [Gemmatimonadota bacterium]